MGITITSFSEEGATTRSLSELSESERVELEWALMNGAGKFEKGN